MLHCVAVFLISSLLCRVHHSVACLKYNHEKVHLLFFVVQFRVLLFHALRFYVLQIHVLQFHAV